MDIELSELLPGRATDEWWERTAYGRDLAVVPPIMGKLLNLQTMPDLVARPVNVAETATVVRYAAERGLPVVPRGGGASAFYNSVPVRGGISLDLSGLRDEFHLDEDQETVTVGAGWRWGMLDAKLRRRGWAVKSYPSSAPVATVGGWFNMEGFGIGSLQYGSLGSQTKKIEVVLADASIQEATADSVPALGWFAGSDGTLGITTALTVGVRRAPAAEGHWLIAFDDIDGLAGALQRAAAATPRPYNVTFHSKQYFDFLRKLGWEVHDGHILGIDYEGDREAAAFGQELAARLAAEFGGRVLPAEVAAAKWQERFYHMRMKRLGPTLLAAEDLLPVTKVGEYMGKITQLSRQLATSFYSYGTVADSGHINMFTGYRTDAAKSLPYIIAMAVTGRLHGTAIALGGRPFAVGLWNTPYLAAIYSADELAEQRRRKKQLDPDNLFNPGKHYAHPPLLAPAMFRLGTGFASMLQRFTGGEE